MKNEAQFQTWFGNWVSKNRDLLPPTAAFELKYEKNNTFNLKQWSQKKSPHQARSLLSAQSAVGVFHKISDMSAGMKPFDCFLISEAKGYLVIYWSQQKDFTITAIDKLLPYLQKNISYFEALTLNETKR